MKKFLAILLLLLLLFNLFGYHALFNYFENNAQMQMEAYLDKQPANVHDLIEIKIPLKVPYIINSEAFERFDGSVKIGNLFYNYFERKISNDTLILLCVINTEENKLGEMKNLYGSPDKDIQAKSKSRSSALLLSLMKSKYNQENIPSYIFAMASAKKSYPEFKDKNTSPAFRLSPEQPPETI